jgi:hypothetical protein
MPPVYSIELLAARLGRLMVLRHVAVGAVDAAVDLVLFAILVFVAGVHYLWAGAAGFLVATGVNYVLLDGIKNLNTCDLGDATDEYRKLMPVKSLWSSRVASGQRLTPPCHYPRTIIDLTSASASVCSAHIRGRT